jgi:hypothetical protein
MAWKASGAFSACTLSAAEEYFTLKRFGGKPFELERLSDTEGG